MSQSQQFNIIIPGYLEPYIQRVQDHLPKSDSHKGQNGKLLIIGGSELFHAASKWSLDVASYFVDMLFYSSVPQNNELIKEAKSQFWDGIIIPRGEIPNYLDEADAVLIGPGMERDQATEEITNHLLTTYPQKRWVIDAGALQMIDSNLLLEHHIITPHQREFERFSKKTPALTLLKGKEDNLYHQGKHLVITGGNAGMTKGGTGDVLAGLVAALYTQHDAMTAAVVASFVNKTAGDYLYSQAGPFFNASQLVEAIPKIFWQILQQ